MIGANGAGKSNFIGAFAFLRAVQEGRLQDTVTAAGGAEKVLHFGSKTTEDLFFGVSFRGGTSGCEISLSPTGDDSLYPAYETVLFHDKLRFAEPWTQRLSPRERGREAGISDSSATGAAGWVHQRLGSWRIYHVHDTSATSPPRKTGKVDDNRYLRPDGSNLAPFLYLLRETDA